MAAEVPETAPGADARLLPGIGSQAALLGLGYLARGVGSLALAALLSRLLGPAGYGEVALFLAVSWGVFYLSGSSVLLAVPGLGVAGARSRELGDVYWAAVAIGLTIGLLAALLALPFLDDFGLPSDVGGLVVGAAIALLALNSVYALLQAQGLAGRVALLQSAERVLAAVIAAIVFATVATSARAAMGGLALATVVLAVAGLAMGPVRPHLRRPRVGRVALRRAIHFSLPVAVVNLCTYVVAWIDLLILGLFLPNAEVGIYALAYQLFTVPLQLAAVWVVAALPSYARRAAASGDGPSIPTDGLALASRWWAALSLAAGLLMVAVLGPVFGADFLRARGLLALLLAGICAIPFYYAIVPVLLAGDRVRRLMWISLIAAAVNAGVDIALVGVFGIWAAAVATLLQTLLVTLSLTYMELGGVWILTLLRATGLPLAAFLALAAWPSSSLTLAAAGVAAAIALVAAARETPAEVWAKARALAPAR